MKNISACGPANYWRDKHGHEVDFVWARRGHPPAAIECKWSSSDFDASGMKAFSVRYPQAKLFVVAQDVERSHQKSFGALRIRFVSLETLVATLESAGEKMSDIAE